MKRYILTFSIVIVIISCQESASYEPTTATNTNAEGETETSNKGGSEDSANQTNDKFYEVTAERPAEVCGTEGFRYLAEGYLFKECGTCHFKENQFGVTEFAVRTDFAHSYEVMTTIVNKDLFVEATIVNAFCNDCLLEKDDPLLADLKYFVEHQTDAQCEGT